MVRRMILTPGSRHARMELEFQTDAEQADWAKALVEGDSSVTVHWDGRKVVLTPKPLLDFEAASAKPAPVVPPVIETGKPADAPRTTPEAPGETPAMAEFIKLLETADDADLDTMRAEMSLPRVKGETAAEMKLRLIAKKRKLLA